MHAPPRLRLEPRASRIACAFTVCGCAATAALIAALPLSWLAAIGAWTIVAASAAHALWRCAGRGLPALIHVGSDRRITVTARDGRSHDGSIADDSYVGALLTVIIWRSDGAPWWSCTRTILIAPDSLPADDFRRLRVLLRYGRPVELGRTSGVDAG